MSVAEEARRLPTSPPQPLRSPRPPRPHNWTYARSRRPPSRTRRLLSTWSCGKAPCHSPRHPRARETGGATRLSFPALRSRPSRPTCVCIPTRRPDSCTEQQGRGRGALRATQKGRRRRKYKQKEGSSGAPGRARVESPAPSAAFVPPPSAVPTSGRPAVSDGPAESGAAKGERPRLARCAGGGEKSRGIHFPRRHSYIPIALKQRFTHPTPPRPRLSPLHLLAPSPPPNILQPRPLLLPT